MGITFQGFNILARKGFWKCDRAFDFVHGYVYRYDNVDEVCNIALSFCGQFSFRDLKNNILLCGRIDDKFESVYTRVKVVCCRKYRRIQPRLEKRRNIVRIRSVEAKRLRA
jgi:hypothetical protein